MQKERPDPIGFAALGLRESILATLSTLGYEAPTPIQERTIPVLLAGKDMIGQAQTGTGKTAAFALPILEKLDLGRRTTQVLVLTPTRELAMQVAEAFHTYAHGMQVTVLPVYGGAPIVPQLKRLERGVQIVVGTPGRLIDHLDRKSLRLDQVRMIVLDEADEMLKMGFIDDVERILGEAPKERQIALFSATMPPEVLRIAARHLSKPVRVEIEHKSIAAPDIAQRFLSTSEGMKLEVLTQILEVEENDATLIFRRTKNGAAELAERLEGRGFAAVAMHGDMKQSERENVIRRLRAGKIEIVVATDVAARGLDVEKITHVINYDIPYDVEAYVHRIGRTGRAGRSGVATLFITPRERRMMREIERFIGTQIKPMRVPTRADVAAKRVATMKETLRKTIVEGDLDMYLDLVEQLIEEGQHDTAEIAAAAVKIASIKPLAVKEVRAVEDTGAPTGRIHDEARPVRLSMSVGKRDGIRPADVVGSIANEADIPGRDIGPIDIRDDVTYVFVPSTSVGQVLERVGRAKFKGRPVNLRLAGPHEGEGPLRPRRPSGPPKRPFNKFVPKGKPGRR
ncbi:MAG TPA: DEAD/DEAH box helicase [Thermoanaerobaculia bacterium]|nr:DEAD/DEAH box helicase [Thermoanaerobaculia bacterium]